MAGTPPIKTLSLLLKMPTSEVYELTKSYGVLRSVTEKVVRDKEKLVFPSGITELKRNHKNYLKSRNFKPNKIVEIWGIQGTGPVSTLKTKSRKLDYRLRLFIPFEWNHEYVTFDTRDITNQQKEKYKACPVEMEAFEHKKILYGIQDAWSDTMICVEGPTDVWRLGPENAFAVSGIEYKQEQVREMSKHFKKVIVMFDDDPQAVKKGRQLVKDLKFRGVESYLHKIKGDPGSMSDKEAKRLTKKLLNK